MNLQALDKWEKNNPKKPQKTIRCIDGSVKTLCVLSHCFFFSTRAHELFPNNLTILPLNVEYHEWIYFAHDTPTENRNLRNFKFLFDRQEEMINV